MGHLYTIFTYPNLIQKFKEELEPCRINWLAAITTTSTAIDDDNDEHIHTKREEKQTSKRDEKTEDESQPNTYTVPWFRHRCYPCSFERSFLPTICVGAPIVGCSLTNNTHSFNTQLRFGFSRFCAYTQFYLFTHIRISALNVLCMGDPM